MNNVDKARYFIKKAAVHSYLRSMLRNIKLEKIAQANTGTSNQGYAAGIDGSGLFRNVPVKPGITGDYNNGKFEWYSYDSKKLPGGLTPETVRNAWNRQSPEVQLRALKSLGYTQNNLNAFNSLSPEAQMQYIATLSRGVYNRNQARRRAYEQQLADYHDPNKGVFVNGRNVNQELRNIRAARQEQARLQPQYDQTITRMVQELPDEALKDPKARSEAIKDVRNKVVNSELGKYYNNQGKTIATNRQAMFDKSHLSRNYSADGRNSPSSGKGYSGQYFKDKGYTYDKSGDRWVKEKLYRVNDKLFTMKELNGKGITYNEQAGKWNGIYRLNGRLYTTEELNNQGLYQDETGKWGRRPTAQPV